MISDDLISRLEAAREGNRELDLDIAEAVDHKAEGGRPMWHSIREGIEREGRHKFLSDSLGFVWQVPRFTRSLDAAMSLVPEGWWVKPLEIARTKGAPRAYCHCKLYHDADTVGEDLADDEPFEVWAENCFTAQLALCLASLKALQAIERAREERR